jgi:hypothetical protein
MRLGHILSDQTIAAVAVAVAAAAAVAITIEHTHNPIHRNQMPKGSPLNKRTNTKIQTLIATFKTR